MSITNPANVSCIYGTNGNNITWTITGLNPSTGAYVIFRNGTSIANCTWASGISITWNVDGLAAGSYNYTILATNGAGAIVHDTVIVKVIPNYTPAITHPADITYTAGQAGNTISWTITDASTGTRSYIVYHNGTSIASGSWTSGVAVAKNVDGLAAGSYNYTIVASDGLGGVVMDGVVVTVLNELHHAPC